MPEKHPSRKLDKEFKIRRAVELLNTRQYKSAIITAMKEEFGLTSSRHVERYLKEARDRMFAETQKDKQEHVCDSFNFYVTVRDNPLVRPVDRLRAQEQIDRLLGLAAPTKIAPVTPDGEEAWSPARMDEIKSKLFERLTQLKQPSKS